MNNPIWYTMDENLAMRDRHEVSLEEALAIVRRYVAEVQPFYKWGEEALAATMFGFHRLNKGFIEICVHSPSQISVRFEPPNEDRNWIVRLWCGGFQYEETVYSLYSLEDRVRQFFTLAANELRGQLH